MNATSLYWIAGTLTLSSLVVLVSGLNLALGTQRRFGLKLIAGSVAVLAVLIVLGMLLLLHR